MKFDFGEVILFCVCKISFNMWYRFAVVIAKCSGSHLFSGHRWVISCVCACVIQSLTRACDNVAARSAGLQCTSPTTSDRSVKIIFIISSSVTQSRDSWKSTWHRHCRYCPSRKTLNFHNDRYSFVFGPLTWFRLIRLRRVWSRDHWSCLTVLADVDRWWC